MKRMDSSIWMIICGFSIGLGSLFLTYVHNVTLQVLCAFIVTPVIVVSYSVGVVRLVSERRAQRTQKHSISLLVGALDAEDDHAKLTEAHNALVDIGREGIPSLREALSRPEPMVRGMAAVLLGELDAPDAEEHLLRELAAFDFSALPGGRYYLWAGLTHHLGRRRARLAVPYLIAALDEGDDVAGAAAEALGDIGDERAIEPLRRTAASDDPPAQQSAENALAKLSGGRSGGASRNLLT
jgi:HEAT repeat protein